MGWLDALLGKGSTKKIRQVQKVAKAVAPKDKPTAKKTLPKIEWRKSEKGNDTAEFEGFRVTIFKDGEEWNYCISEILDEQDLADGIDDVPDFGEGFETKAKAKKAALEQLQD